MQRTRSYIIESGARKVKLFSKLREKNNNYIVFFKNRQKRQTEKLAKEAAVERRRLEIEMERKKKIEKMDENRKEREQRVEKIQEEKEKLRQEIVS